MASALSLQSELQIVSLLGNTLRQQGEYERAEGPLLRAIEIAEGMPSHPEEIIFAWNNFGVLCKYAGWFERGERAYERALAAAARLVEHREAMTATLLHNLGGLHHARGRFDLAEEPARRAWEMRRRLLGDNDPATLADATAYAAVLDRLGRYEESRPIYEHALGFYERTFGPEHYETAATLHNLALVERAAGNHGRAEQLARRALDIKTKLLGASHPDTALSAMNLAAMMMTSRPEEAEGLLHVALAALTRALEPHHPHLVRCRQLLEGMRNPDHHPKSA